MRDRAAELIQIDASVRDNSRFSYFVFITHCNRAVIRNESAPFISFVGHGENRSKLRRTFMEILAQLVELVRCST